MKILYTTKQNQEKTAITTAMVRENGFIYSLDVSLIMFSSGNGTEKKRMISIDVANQVIGLFCVGEGSVCVEIYIYI